MYIYICMFSHLPFNMLISIVSLRLLMFNNDPVVAVCIVSRLALTQQHLALHAATAICSSLTL